MADAVEWITNPLKAAMDSATDGAYSGSQAFGASLVLPGVASIYNMQMQKQQNERNEKMTWDMYQQSRADQNTAVQRRAADMKAAGINPLMAAGEGAGTSTGSMGIMPAPQLQGPPILEALQLQETIKNNEAQRGLIKAQTKSINQQTRIQEPIENLLPNANSLLNKGKNYLNEKKQQWNDANDKQENMDFKINPIKKNPNKKLQKFQQFWNRKG